MKVRTTYYPALEDVKKAAELLRSEVYQTPLQQSFTLSERFNSNIFLKREDTQIVRSYKIRGAYNKIRSLEGSERCVVCASAGNHAQGVALSCYRLGIKGVIFMPATTPKQKIQQVNMFGKDKVEIIIEGDTFDDSSKLAKKYCEEHNGIYVHPFNDELVIEGQATVGLEICNDADFEIDYLFLPVGGGGLSAGVSSVFKTLSPKTKIIGVEPKGAPAMYEAFKNGEILITKSTGDFLGSSIQGEKLGMSGGVVIIKGNAGHRAGFKMRSGVIYVKGNAKDFIGCQMIAGTIIIGGKIGLNIGLLMKRGTIILKKQKLFAPYLNYSGKNNYIFLKIIQNYLEKLSNEFKNIFPNTYIKKYLGDINCKGMGEILILS